MVYRAFVKASNHLVQRAQSTCRIGHKDRVHPDNRSKNQRTKPFFSKKNRFFKKKKEMGYGRFGSSKNEAHSGTVCKAERIYGDWLARNCSRDIKTLSQHDFSIEGRAMVTDVPITYLGYVNRDTGVIEETGHPLDGRAIEDTILIYPKGSGSTVAPYVLMGLLYENKGPLAIINRDVCPLTLPACSLLNVPYGHGFVEDPCMVVNDGDRIRFKREQGKVSIEILERV